MNQQSPETKKQDGGNVAPQADGSTSEPNQTVEPPNSDSNGEMHERHQSIWGDLKSITIDRKIELLLVCAIVIATIVNAIWRKVRFGFLDTYRTMCLAPEPARTAAEGYGNSG
jgi:hypothetical protein